MSLSAISRTDPQMAALITQHVRLQRSGFTLIPSENHASQAVRQALESPLNDKYAEGYPGKRYYPGNEAVDRIESLTIERMRAVFGAEHANVQPDSGAVANVAIYHACRVALQARLRPEQDGPERKLKILSMALPHGGHLSHGWTITKVFADYEIRQYGVRENDHHLDMSEVARLARDFHPDVIVSGFSAYPGRLDFPVFAEIAEEVGAYHASDIAHVAGLVAAGVYPNPVPYADAVSLTTHKTFRGPRGGVVLSKLADRFNPDAKFDFAAQIDRAVFPGIQGGPHEHAIAAKGIAAHEAAQPAFREYAELILANIAAMYEALCEGGLKIPFGPPENHLMLVDITPLGTTGKPAQQWLESAGIFANMNAIPFDKNKPFNPSGIRVGTPAVTTRGLKPDDTKRLGQLIVRVLKSKGDEAQMRSVAGEVRELAEAFPVYPDWLSTGPDEEETSTSVPGTRVTYKMKSKKSPTTFDPRLPIGTVCKLPKT